MHVIVGVALVIIAAAYLPAALPVLRFVTRWALALLIAGAFWCAAIASVAVLIYLAGGFS